MSSLNNIINQTEISNIKGENDVQQSNSPTYKSSNNSTGEKNRTDPKVCHDPSLKFEGIARIFSNQNKFGMEEGELSTNNVYDMTKIDGIEYPLIVINNRNIENHDILYMDIDYTGFLTRLRLTIYDLHEAEQKINTSQMSGLIRICIIAKVDKIYKKVLLNFRIYDVRINESDPTIVTYYAKYYVPGFRQINIQHIWMKSVCNGKNCGQGGHVNANTWEMLHKIAELSGLGFATTKQCKEIEDRVIRNIYSQRFDQYIEEQLLHCGLTEENIFDAWVDLYGYIIMVNVSWVLNENITPSDLDITINYGIHGTTNDTPENKIETVDRTLTNYNLMGSPSNLEIASYNTIVDNNSIRHGTLEKVYSINFDTTLSNYEVTDIQSKQDSVDGDFIEDYNTGKNRPIPKFNFNDDNWTGLSGGYDLHKQKIIRNAFFRKKRQSILHVILKNVNLGLQRGTLVNIAIFDSDPINKKITFQNVDNLGSASNNAQQSNLNLPAEINEDDLVMDGGADMPNIKLSGLYYIDGMKFEYSRDDGRIIQSLFLIKKGKTSGYHNKHNLPRVPLDKVEVKETLPQSAPYLLEK